MGNKQALTPRYLYVDKILKEKNPKLAKKLPRFLVRLFEKIIKQDELNEIIQRHGTKSGVAFIDGVFKQINLKIVIKGAENIPTDRTLSFAANHPLGGLDGLAVAHYLCDRFPGTKILVNDILMNIDNLKECFLPVNKHGGQVKANVDLINSFYESDRHIMAFPAGLVSRKTNGIITDLEWKKNFITKTVKYKRDLVPLHISGHNSKLFYNVARFRKIFGIKANLEMLLLPSEMFKLKNQTLVLTFGKPIPYTTFDTSKRPAAWAEEVKNKVYQLG